MEVGMTQLKEKMAKAHQDSMEYFQDLGKNSLENFQRYSQEHYDSTKNLLAKSIDHGILSIKDSKDMLQTYKVKTIHDVAANWATYQAHMASLLYDKKQEIVAMADSAIEKAKKNLLESVDSTVAKVSKSSDELTDSFHSLLESSMQSYDTHRSEVSRSYTNLWKALNSQPDSHNQDKKNSSEK
jgi:hypothetical protein